MRRVITAPEVEACLAEMSEEGRAGINELADQMQWNFHNLENHKQMGRYMALELIAAVAVFMELPRAQRNERLNW